jgi:hypothetical protein
VAPTADSIELLVFFIVFFLSCSSLSSQLSSPSPTELLVIIIANRWWSVASSLRFWHCNCRGVSREPSDPTCAGVPASRRAGIALALLMRKQSEIFERNKNLGQTNQTSNAPTAFEAASRNQQAAIVCDDSKVEEKRDELR